MKIKLLYFLITALLFLFACNGDGNGSVTNSDNVPDNAGSPLFISSPGSRELDPDNTGDEIDSFVAYNSFAFDLYHSISNELWRQKDHLFLQTYLDTLMINYGAGIRLVDFMNNPEHARLDINTWIAEETENKIKDLLGQNDITNQARLVLTNTIYFNPDFTVAIYCGLKNLAATLVS